MTDAATDWNDHRLCPVCKAPTGQPCRALTGYVTGGQPGFIATELARPHTSRPLGARAERERGSR